MKFDKESIFAITICMVLLFAWPSIYQWIYPPQTPPAGQKVEGKSPDAGQSQPQAELKSGTPGTQAPAEKITEKIPDKTIPNDKPAAQEPPAEEPSAVVPDIPLQKLSNEFSEVTVSPAKGGIEKVVLGKFKLDDKTGQVELNFDLGSPALSLAEPGKKWKLAGVKAFEDAGILTVERAFATEQSQFEIVQQFAHEGEYTVAYRVEIRNSGGSPLEMPELHINTGGLPPIIKTSGDTVTSEYQTIDTCLAENLAVKSQEPGKADFREVQENKALWVAVTNKYFTAFLIPDQPFTGGNLVESRKFSGMDSKGKQHDWFYLEGAGIVRDISVPPGGKFELKMKFYAGPKEYHLLKKMAPKATELMHFGWKWLEAISQLLLVCLIWLKGISGSYGMSIILLTVIVKLIFWPVTEKANVSMKKMQKIQPIVQEIRSKYKNDQQKMNQKIMQLYKEEKVNPLGGCLPILLQIPVFFALYNTLGGAVELRQSSFLWAADLSKPDTIFSIPLGAFGALPFNPLMILMTATMVIQQKLTPSTMDPMQQKIMLMMPFIMLVMLYSLPSGLTLYWTISQGISIIQLLHNLRRDKKEKEEESRATA